MLFRQASTAIAALYSSAQLINAAPSPLTPATSNAGATCRVQWTPDTTGQWTKTTIDLMTGSNKAMVHVTNVATGVNTTSSKASLTWTCPTVSPNAPIYFYQFTLADGTSPTWTTRFAIASATGDVVAPENASQPDGQPIPWGTGKLVGSSGGGGSSNTTTTATSTGTSSSSSSSSVLSTTSTGIATTSSSTSTAPGGGSTTTITTIPTSSPSSLPTTSTLPTSRMGSGASSNVITRSVVAGGVVAAGMILFA